MYPKYYPDHYTEYLEEAIEFMKQNEANEDPNRLYGF